VFLSRCASGPVTPEQGERLVAAPERRNGVDPQPIPQRGRVDAAEIHRPLQVAVHQVGQAGWGPCEARPDAGPGQEHRARGAVVGPERAAGPYPHQGETLWLAKTVIARSKDDRTIAGDALIGSQEYQVAALNGTGGTPDNAYHDLEERLANLKSHEF
jgi:hypothetical protein